MPKLDYEKCLKDNVVQMNLQRHFNNEIRRIHANPPVIIQTNSLTFNKQQR